MYHLIKNQKSIQKDDQTMIKNKEETSDKKYTLKEFIEELGKYYKYIRIIELKSKMYFLSSPHLQPFDKFLLVSNDLEKYEDTEIEIDKINVLIQKAQAELIILPIIPRVLTIFELRIKNNLKKEINKGAKRMSKTKKLRFYSEQLLYKWGFKDGALIEDWLTDNYTILDLEENLKWSPILFKGDEKLFNQISEYSEELLLAIVDKFLIPKIQKHHVIKVQKTLTSHNPIRIIEFDGREIDNFNPNSFPNNLINISPEYIELSNRTILRFCKKKLKEYNII